MQKFIIPLGGALAGSGVMSMLFGWSSGDGQRDMAEQISTIGYSGVFDIHITQYGQLAFGLIFVGLALMVFGNATAWKETGGY